MRSDRWRKIISKSESPFTVFIRDASKGTLCLSVNKDTTVQDMLVMIFSRNSDSLPASACISLAASNRFLYLPLHESLGNLGIGSMSMITLRVRTLGGSAISRDDQCAVGSDGKLLDASEIDWVHDPEDDSQRSSRNVKPTWKISDPNNDGEIEVTSHQNQRSEALSTSNISEKVSGKVKGKRKAADAPATKQPVKKTKSNAKSSSTSKAPQAASCIADVQDSAPADIQSDTEVEDFSEETSRGSFRDRTRDIDEFFESAVSDRRKCKKCRNVSLVAHASTLRRHIEADHKASFIYFNFWPQYDAWCTRVNFKTMLPKARKAAAAAASQSAVQTTLDPHLTEPTVKIPYSDRLFREAAIEWLIATDQPLQALEHPKFIHMIDVASRATNGVVIPGRKATRTEIKSIFKRNLNHLRKRFQGDTIKGLVSLTCDAWQASNTDAYFAVTAHWIEDTGPNSWLLQSNLIGFTQMNSAHDGVRLGRALYKVIARVGLEPKRKGLPYWNHEHRRIRCFAHVINLATQAVISTYSKSKYFNPANPEEHEPDTETINRDEIGLIRSIVVKARSSAKRKELFKTIQTRPPSQHNGPPLMLLLDMVVRWSSTFIMLERAESLKQFVDTFVYEIGLLESENTDKRRKIDQLKLSDKEWQRVKLFLNLLAYANSAQQMFSSDTEPSLHVGLPALEGLHKAWSSRVAKPKYSPFADALQAGVNKVSGYYSKTELSDAYMMAMILHPEKKMRHFIKNWEPDLCDQVRNSAERIFKERYIELCGSLEASQTQRNASPKKDRRHRVLLDDSDSDDEMDNQTKSNSVQPWLQEFNDFLDAKEKIPSGMSLVQWWGLHSTDYPVWASLARDYCAIMASSVSSERTFSSAGITISKRRNRLGKDIVEPLQFLKCALRRNLIFREAPLEDDNVEADDGTLEDETEDWVELIDVDEAEDSGEDLDYDGFN
ncbi:hypothetical protein D9758_017952 [Tetrapyrgos nigripes]|uniref:HAT C-terminal dimerisation domain-containing protein n=2 Tax=Tetrapyrgos nigripes TaxID=182062 RepID=A0A8H5BTK1_9AGAR|nr:hypothetical protein D9758_017952 [Tetrapyrgos nigripes]